MKIIAIDSFGRDDDVLIESGLTEDDATARVARRNADAGIDPAWHWFVVADDYELHTWHP